MRTKAVCIAWPAALCLVAFTVTAGAQGFVNFETPHVHPLDLSPDGNTLAACNTPDGHVEIYDVSSGLPVHTKAIQVGVNPVSVRFRTNNELWVVNVISDTVSIIDISLGLVINTIDTADEPADVVFADTPERAFVSCARPDIIQVYLVSTLGLVGTIPILGDDPRALATNAAKTQVYAAVFESGNHTTILAGGLLSDAAATANNLPNVVDDGDGPHFGANPHFNDAGTAFNPPINPALLPLLPLQERGLIVRKDTGAGTWLDNEAGDWTAKVSGANASDSGRVQDWDMVDNDVAIIDASTFAVTYATELMNIVMAIATDPSGNVTVVGTESLNDIRFEPVITGTFLRVRLASFAPATPSTTTITDLNVAHLAIARGGPAYDQFDPDTDAIPQPDRDKSIGDPRGVVWLSSGKGYITGMGSNNVVPMANSSARTSIGAKIEVAEGPTGIVASGDETKVYVLSKFAATLSTIDTSSDSVIDTVQFFDPTPSAIKIGRKHLYSTHDNSGLGHIACASCHLDGTMDGLAWDLGDPSGSVAGSSGENLGFGLANQGTFDNFHPMKGPMTTQTLRDIIGKEPFHWRGDRRGLEAFAGAFKGLQGADTPKSAAGILEFKNFLASIHFPPNPFRDLDNTFPATITLDRQFASGRFSGSGGKNRGDQMDPGDPTRGLQLYMGTAPGQLQPMDTAFNCVTCHTLPIGNGPDGEWNGSAFVQIAPDPITGNRHIGLTGNDGSTNQSIKVPQLRSGYLKVGMDLTHNALPGGDDKPSLKGFGYLHDGSVDSLTSFFNSSVFNPQTDQDVSDLVALMLCFTGSDFDIQGLGDLSSPANQNTAPSQPTLSEPPSFQTSKDAHAGVGRQLTINTATPSAPDTTFINSIIAMADAGIIDVVVKGIKAGDHRGWYRLDSSGAKATPIFKSDLDAETNTLAELLALAATNELTFTVVPEGRGLRAGVDRDGDGALNFSEILAGTDPADPTSGALLALNPGTYVLIALVLLSLAMIILRKKSLYRF